MLTVENIVKWYAQREQSGDWAAWAKANPDKDRILTEAMLEHGRQ